MIKHTEIKMNVRNLTIKQLMILRNRARMASIKADREGDDALWARIRKDYDVIEHEISRRGY
jgi:hypothetical protein